MSDRPDESDNSVNPESAFLPLEANARVVEEQGRWVVMLNVTSWDPRDGEHPVTNNWKRISDYATKHEATVAATWMERSANRKVRPPSGF